MYRGLWERQAMSEANERRNMTGSRRWAQLTGQDPDFAVPISEPDLIHEQFIYDLVEMLELLQPAWHGVRYSTPSDPHTG